MFVDIVDHAPSHAWITFLGLVPILMGIVSLIIQITARIIITPTSRMKMVLVMPVTERVQQYPP